MAMTKKQAAELSRKMILRFAWTGKTLAQVKPCQCCGSVDGEAYTKRVYADVKADARRSIAVVCEPCLFIPKDTILAMQRYRSKKAQ